MNQRLKPMMNALKPLQAEAGELAKQLQKIDSRLQQKHIQQEAELRLKPFFSAFDAVVRHCLDELQARVTDARRVLQDSQQPPTGEVNFLRRKEIRDLLHSMTPSDLQDFISRCDDVSVYFAWVEDPNPVYLSDQLDSFLLRFFIEERAMVKQAQDALAEARLMAARERDRLEQMLDNAVPRAT